MLILLIYYIRKYIIDKLSLRYTITTINEFFYIFFLDWKFIKNYLIYNWDETVWKDPNHLSFLQKLPFPCPNSFIIDHPSCLISSSKNYLLIKWLRKLTSFIPSLDFLLHTFTQIITLRYTNTFFFWIIINLYPFWNCQNLIPWYRYLYSFINH